MSDAHGPTCIGFILDGNRRWAREHGLPTFEGYRRGFERAREIVEWSREAGVPDIVMYAFSTENWNRSPEEVAYLMDLYEEFAEQWADEVAKKEGRIRFIGERSRFRETLQKKMKEVEERTATGTRGTLWVALSYGGRAEILDAVNTLLASGVHPVDEAGFRKVMWSADMPDPDLIIRTSGEHRLSNFLPWQSVYSELFFPTAKLPEFTKADFLSILQEYAERGRRHGR